MSASSPNRDRRPFPWPVVGRNLFAPNHDRTLMGVIVWWERRRLAYNAFVCAAGILGMMAYLTLDERYGEVCVGDMAAFQIVAGFIGANVCYTAGWVTEALLLRAQPPPAATFGRRMFVAGLAFSLAAIALPAAVILIRMALHDPPVTQMAC